jgi:methylglutaconyl-CoA hydratase
VVGVIQGAAFGGGVGLVACCDIAIATSSASFCLSEVRLGLIRRYLTLRRGGDHARFAGALLTAKF